MTDEQVRAAALALPGAREQETWHRPTFRIGEELFATLHDDLLILRGQKTTQAARLAADPRLRPAPYWGKHGWVAIPLADVAPGELAPLLRDARALLGEPGAAGPPAEPA